MKRDALLAIISEWLEEWEMPSLVSRYQPAIDPADLKHILAIVGPRRSGKTFFMYQLIQSLLQSSQYSKEHILFLDFEDYRLGEFTGDTMD
jgi:predicted AAA+ superfamily ATPase